MIRIFVGCAANNEDLESQAVLEWSLRKHASENLSITWMQLSQIPVSPWGGWNTEQWATPFSGFRWAIPQVCGFEGRAIYTDSDVMFCADVAELWKQEIPPSAAILAKGGGSWRLCVSLWDCHRAAALVAPLDQQKTFAGSHKLMSQKATSGGWIAPFDGNWNCLDGENYPTLADPDIKAIHYTNIPTQPQLKYAIPRLAREGQQHWNDGPIAPHPRPDLVALFDELLIEAAANGYPPERYRRDPFGPYRKKSLKR